MLPQFVSLGPLTLNLYPLLIALAVLGPLAWYGFKHRDARVFAVALVVAAFTFVSGRAGYVALNWGYFREHPNEIVALSGLSEHAAVIGAGIGYWLLVKARQPITNNQYITSSAFVLIVAAASIGCIPNGCAYGREVFWQTDGEQSLAWLLRADWPDATLVNNPRWPTQALLAGWMLVGAALMLVVTRWQGDKAAAAGRNHPFTLSPAKRHPVILVILFALGDFLVQFLRGDAAPMPGGLRMYQWFDVTLAGLAVALFIARRAKL